MIFHSLQGDKELVGYFLIGLARIYATQYIGLALTDAVPDQKFINR